MGCVPHDQVIRIHHRHLRSWDSVLDITCVQAESFRMPLCDKKRKLPKEITSTRHVEDATKPKARSQKQRAKRARSKRASALAARALQVFQFPSINKKRYYVVPNYLFVSYSINCLFFFQEEITQNIKKRVDRWPQAFFPAKTGFKNAKNARKGNYFGWQLNWYKIAGH